MEDYIHTIYLKSTVLLKEDEIERISVLLEADSGIENFRISTDGVYLEYNTYLYSQNQIEELISGLGFNKKKKWKPGFVRRQIMNLAESNKKTYGNRRLNCCQ